MRNCEADIAQRMVANEMKVSTTITLDENEVRSLVALANIAYELMLKAYKDGGINPGDEGLSFSEYSAQECEQAFVMANTIGLKLVP